MYTPKHLEWLDRCERDATGWPTFVTENAREWCRTMLRRGFTKYGRLDIDLARRCIYDGSHVRVQEDGPLPECLKVGTWDAMYGITHRALLEVGATETWEIIK